MTHHYRNKKLPRAKMVVGLRKDQRIAIGNSGVVRLFVLYIGLLLLARSSRGCIRLLIMRRKESADLRNILLQSETPSRLHMFVTPIY